MELDVCESREDMGADEGAETIIRIDCLHNYFQ